MVEQRLGDTRRDRERQAGARFAPRRVPPLTADEVPRLIATARPQAGTLRWLRAFKWASACAPATCIPSVTRDLPRYARGKQGTIERDHGVFVFPDTNAQFLGEKPQHVYSVRFAARELWGEQASPRDAVYHRHVGRLS